MKKVNAEKEINRRTQRKYVERVKESGGKITSVSLDEDAVLALYMLKQAGLSQREAINNAVVQYARGYDYE